jgi:O-antigen/teichoic acid export membrane protein
VTLASHSGVDGHNLRGRVLRGLGWKVATQIVMQGSRAIVAVALARLLLPEQFGLAMMAVVVSSLALIFSDLALGAALIQRKELTEADRSTVFWLSVTVGLGFSCACALLAGPLAALYGEPRVESLFVLISPIFVLTALGSTHTTLLTREMDFKSLEIRMMVGTLAGAAVGVSAAAFGMGSEAVIIQYLTTSTACTLLVWVTLRWRPRLIFSVASLRSLGAYSARVFGSRVLWYVSRNADSLLIGRVLGAAALGAYTIAYNLMLVPFSKVAGPIQEVMFPAMARIQNDRARIGSIWLRVNHIVAAFALPAMLGLVVVAPEFVSVVLGDRWQAAVTPIQILAWVGALQSLVRLNGIVQQACDRADIMFRWALVTAAANLVAFGVGVSWGIVGVATAYAVANTVLQPANVWLTGRIVGVPFGTFWRNLAGTARATAVMLIAIVPLRQLLLAEHAGAELRLGAVVVAGAVVYVLACAVLDRPLLDELRSLRGRRAPRAVAAPAHAG